MQSPITVQAKALYKRNRNPKRHYPKNKQYKVHHYPKSERSKA